MLSTKAPSRRRAAVPQKVFSLARWVVTRIDATSEPAVARAGARARATTRAMGGGALVRIELIGTRNMIRFWICRLPPISSSNVPRKQVVYTRALRVFASLSTVIRATTGSRVLTLISRGQGVTELAVTEPVFEVTQKIK